MATATKARAPSKRVKPAATQAPAAAIASPRSLPALKSAWPGIAGKYLGILTNKAGELYVLVALDAVASKLKWQGQMDWAASLEADLPNRAEAAHIFSVAPELMKSWIWTNEVYSASTAWYCLSNGGQYFRHRSSEGSGLAVRRLPLCSFDPFAGVTEQSTEYIAKLRAMAAKMLAACDQVEAAVAETA